MTIEEGLQKKCAFIFLGNKGLIECYCPERNQFVRLYGHLFSTKFTIQSLLFFLFLWILLHQINFYKFNQRLGNNLE